MNDADFKIFGGGEFVFDVAHGGDTEVDQGTFDDVAGDGAGDSAAGCCSAATAGTAGPEIRTIATPPRPAGVARATMVSP